MAITVDQAISDVVEAKSEATGQKIAFAVAAKQLRVQKSQGEAIVELIDQAVTVQKQIDAGHLDVRV